MTQLTENFTRHEFRCRGLYCCGHSAPLDPKLIQGLQELRNTLSRPIRINSGFRCLTYNLEIGSTDASQHCLGRAADIRVDKTRPELVLEAAKLVKVFSEGGIGIYDDFVHVDVRGKFTRWDGRTGK